MQCSTKICTLENIPFMVTFGETIIIGHGDLFWDVYYKAVPLALTIFDIITCHCKFKYSMGPYCNMLMIPV